MATIAYVDVGRRKTHTVFFPETGQTVMLESLIALLSTAVTEVYVDALFPNVLGELYELARNGLRVFHLRRLSLIPLNREKQGLEKNDENDAKLLASIPADEFRELTEPQIKLRMLINEYYAVADTLKKVKQKEKVTPNNVLGDIKSLLRRQQYAIEKKILAEAEKTLPKYSLVREALGLNGVSLVTLLTYVDFTQGFDKILRQVGRTAHHKMTRRHSRKAIRALGGLGLHGARHGGERYGQLYQYYLGTLESKKKALLRVQTWILKDIHHILTGRQPRDITNPSKEGLGQPEKESRPDLKEFLSS